MAEDNNKKSNLWDLAGAVVGTGANIVSTAMTNRANERMQQQQNAWNLEQWHRNNEYNSPAAQLQRMKAAGLNPDLMYGQNASGAAGNSASPASGTNPIPKQPFFLDPTMTAQIRALNAKAYSDNMNGNGQDLQNEVFSKTGLQQALKNLGLTDTEIQKNVAQAEELHTRVDDMKRKWDLLEIQKQDAMANIQKTLEETKKITLEQATEEQACNLIVAQLEGQELSNEQQKIINHYLPQQQQAELARKWSEVKKNQAAAENLDADTVYKKAQTAYTNALTDSEELKQAGYRWDNKIKREQHQQQVYITGQEKVKKQFAYVNETLNSIGKAADIATDVYATVTTGGANKTVKNLVETIDGYDKNGEKTLRTRTLTEETVTGKGK